MQWFCSTTTISTLKSVEERSGKPQKATHRCTACARIGAAARPARYLVDSTLYFTPAFGPRRRAHRSEDRARHRLDASSRWRKTVNTPKKVKTDRGRNARRSSSRLLSRVPRTRFHTVTDRSPDPHAGTTEVCSGCAAPGPAQASQARHTSEPGRGAERERPHTPLLLRTLATVDDTTHATDDDSTSTKQQNSSAEETTSCQKCKWARRLSPPSP